MAKAKQSKSGGRSSTKKARSRNKSGNKFQDEELQGRGGESLPSRERTVVGNRPEGWERDESGSDTGRRVRAQDRIFEIEYERGPGSRFQIEGQGPRSKRARSKGS